MEGGTEAHVFLPLPHFIAVFTKVSAALFRLLFLFLYLYFRTRPHQLARGPAPRELNGFAQKL